MARDAMRGAIRRRSRRIAPLLLVLVLVAAPAGGVAGDLDAAFGGDGKVVLPFEGFGLRDVAATDGGGASVGGTVTPETGVTRFGVVRLTTGGVPDTGFSGDGLATATFTTLAVTATAVASDAGRVVVVGDGREGSGPTRFALARFEADGDPDPTFGDAGVGRLWTTIDVDGTSPADHATDVAVQPDGAVLVVGSADGDHRAVVLRYEEDGDLDPSFSGNGLAITSLGTGPVRADAVAMDQEGRIVIAGRAGSDLFLARFHADGSSDLSFGQAGRVRIDLGGRERALGLAIDALGRAVVAGRRTAGGASAMLVARIRPGGSLDPRFDGDGWRVLPAGTGATDVRVQADGKIVVGGTDGTRFLLMRLRANGASDATFGGDGKTTTTFACCQAGVSALAAGPGGSTLAGGGGDRAILARYLAA